MSITTQLYSEQTSPTTTFSSQSATTLTFADQTSPTVTFTEQSPTEEGTFYGVGYYDRDRYHARDLIMGRR
jgi:hypothetical protein